MPEQKHFVVLGLGTFGAALARKLSENGCRVTGVDACQERVEDLKDALYAAIIGDATEYETLKQLPLQNVNAVLIGLGENITHSLLATLHAKELGAKRIIAKGVTEDHGKILKKLGVERVVFPEIEIARELADQLTWPNIIEFLPIGSEYSFFEVAVPDSFTGMMLQETNLRRRFGVWVVGVKDALSGDLTMFPDGQFRFGADQLLLVVGKQKDQDRLKELK